MLLFLVNDAVFLLNDHTNTTENPGDEASKRLRMRRIEIFFLYSFGTFYVAVICVKVLL